MIRNLLILFYEFFKIALFVVGGGYAIIAVADEVFSRKYKWIKEGEFIEQLSLFQMIPGIMAGHAAIFLGRKVCGFFGSVVALIAVALPSIIIFSFVSMGYNFIPIDNHYLAAAFAGLRASITGVIIAMLLRSWKKSIAGLRGYLALLIATAALFYGVSILLVIALAILIGISNIWISSNKKSLSLKSISFAPLLFLQYGSLAFGGGYVLIPFYLRDFVGPTAPYLQIPAEEFANLIALTQMTPGPIGINGATFFGYRLFGFFGAITTSICLLIPGFIILSLALISLDRFRENAYVKSILSSLRPVTSSMMILAAYSFAGMSVWTITDASFVFHPISLLIALFTTVAVLKRYLSIVRIIFLAAIISLIPQLFH